MASSVKIPVLIDTNLETHLAMAVSLDITAGDLKREFRREHSICFPNIGEIRITGLMVKRKSCLYHLPDSMAIKNVFQGQKGIWFLSMGINLVSNTDYPCSSSGLVAELGVSDCNGRNVTKSQKAEKLMETENKPRKMKRKRSVDLEGLMQELLTPANVPSKKKKTRVEEKKFTVKVLNEGKNKLPCRMEEVPGVSSLGYFYNSGKKKESDDKEEQISQPTVDTSGCNERKVTDSQKDENHTETENKPRKMKRKRSVDLEGLMQELFTPVNVANKKKKTRVKEKKLTEKVLNEGKNKFPYTTDEVSGVSSLGHFYNSGNKKESNDKEEQISQPTVDTPTGPTVSSSEIVSVTGIMTKYFPEFDEVKSNDSHLDCPISDEFGSHGCYEGQLGESSRTKKIKHSEKVVLQTTPQTIKTPPRMLSLLLPTEPKAETSRGKYGRTEVGNRLVVAANDLRISTSNKKAANTVCQSKVGKLSDSLVRNIVFEVNDGDD